MLKVGGVRVTVIASGRPIGWDQVYNPSAETIFGVFRVD